MMPTDRSLKPRDRRCLGLINSGDSEMSPENFIAPELILTLKNALFETHVTLIADQEEMQQRDSRKDKYFRDIEGR